MAQLNLEFHGDVAQLHLEHVRRCLGVHGRERVFVVFVGLIQPDGGYSVQQIGEMILDLAELMRSIPDGPNAHAAQSGNTGVELLVRLWDGKNGEMGGGRMLLAR